MFEIQGARHMFSPEAMISCRRMSGVYQEFWVEKNGSYHLLVIINPQINILKNCDLNLKFVFISCNVVRIIIPRVPRAL